MTEEEKQLLLKDLCARLPYVTYYDLSYYGHKTRAIIQEFIAGKESLKSLVKVNTIVGPIPFENIKPYLRPMSSMTEKETYIFRQDILNYVEARCIHSLGCGEYSLAFTEANYWLDAHHFDYLGLIEKGLALEAPEGMYNKH